MNKSVKPKIDGYSTLKLGALCRTILVSLSGGILLTPVCLLLLFSMSRIQMFLVVLVFVGLFGTVFSAINATTPVVFVSTVAYVFEIFWQLSVLT